MFAILMCGAVGALSAGCGGSPEWHPKQATSVRAERPAERNARSEVDPRHRVLQGDGWSIVVPRGWIQHQAKAPFAAALQSPGPGHGRFTIHTVPLQGSARDEAAAFVESSIQGARSRGVRQLARRPLRIGSAEGVVVEYVTRPRDKTLLGIGRVVITTDQALSVVCSSTSSRYVTAKDTCKDILGTIQVGQEARGSDAPGLLLEGERQKWSLRVPSDWRRLAHEAPMVALAVSGDDPKDSISVSVLAAPVRCTEADGIEWAHAYLADEVAQESFRVLERREVSMSGRAGLEFDFFKERSSPPVRIAQVYLVKGRTGMVLSCGTAESADASVRDDCQTMFASLRFDDGAVPLAER